MIGAVDVFEHAKCPADAETLGHTIAQFAAKWKVRGAERVVLGFLSRADTSVKALPMSICPHPK